MRRLLARLLRAERALATLPPRDPRQDLDEEVVAGAEEMLEALGAEPPRSLDRAEAAWFEATIRPLLPRWVSYAVRSARWQERDRALYEVRNRREVARRLGGSLGAIPKVAPVFSAAALRAFERLGLLEAEEAACA
jgi:hypothetical protein